MAFEDLVLALDGWGGVIIIQVLALIVLVYIYLFFKIGYDPVPKKQR